MVARRSKKWNEHIEGQVIACEAEKGRHMGAWPTKIDSEKGNGRTKPVKDEAPETIEDRLRIIFASVLAIDDHLITSSSRVVEDLGADSLDLTELAMSIEDEMGVFLGDDCDLSSLRTFEGWVGATSNPPPACERAREEEVEA